MAPEKVGPVIRISDRDGKRLHFMKFLAVKMDFSVESGAKIGTIVITDLRIGDVPASAMMVQTMSISDIELVSNFGMWMVSNSFGDSYGATDPTAYIVIADGKIWIKI